MTFTKYDKGKPRWSLLFHPKLIPALTQCVKVLMYGADKYSEDNWAVCDDPGRYWNAELRHKVAHQAGEWNDPESGLPHLAHKIVSGLFEFALLLERRETETQPICPTCHGKQEIMTTRGVAYACPECRPWLQQESIDNGSKLG